ncbi:hypothetical protein H1R20_g15961, partial [Candolleomyces eurysporus]
MNCFYDAANAKLALDAQFLEPNDDCIDIVSLSAFEIGECAVSQFEQPSALRLIKNVNGEQEEVCVRIPGILCSKTLPPVTRPLSVKNAKHIRHLRQYAKLTGLGCGTFEGLQAKIVEIHQKFARSVTESEHVQDLDFHPYEGDFALDVHARYFTDRHSAPGLKHVPFTTDVDPLHILESIRGVKFIHAPENEVQYCRRVTDESGAASYESMPPAALKEGDLVEAHVAFVAYPLGNHQYKLILSLRTLSLLSSEWREKSEQTRAASLANAAGPSASKRPATTEEGNRGTLKGGILERKFLPIGDVDVASLSSAKKTWRRDQPPTTPEPLLGLGTAVNPESEDAPVPASSLEMELFPPGEEDEGQEPASPERTTSVAPPLPLAATPPARPMVVTNRPTTVINLPHLQPPPGRRPRVAPARKKAQKHEAFPHVEPPGVLPVYEMGPLFLQSSALRELTLPLNAGPVPSWVRPPCGQCASHGLMCMGGDFLNHIRCNQCASLKQTCGFDTRIPRFASSQQLAFAGKASPENISQLVSDVLNLRATAQIAASHAEDLQKMTKAKLETLSLVLQRVYSSEGDAGLSSYAWNVGDLEEVLKFAKDIPLDTPMRFPERLHATMQQAGETEYRWLTNYQHSIYHNPPRVMSKPSEDLENTSFYADKDAMEVEPPQQAQPAPAPTAGPSTFPGSLETQAAPSSQAESSTQSAGNPTGDTSSTATVPAQIPQNIQNQANSLYTLLAPHFHPLLREAAECRRRGGGV